MYASPSRLVGSETTQIRALGEEGELKKEKEGAEGLKHSTIVQVGVSVVVVE